MTGIEQSVWVDNVGDLKPENNAVGAEGAIAPGQGGAGGQPAPGQGEAYGSQSASGQGGAYGGQPAPGQGGDGGSQPAPGQGGAYGSQPAPGQRVVYVSQSAENGWGRAQRGTVMPPPMVRPAAPAPGAWNTQNPQNSQNAGMSAYRAVAAPAETPETKRMKENYAFLARGALLYGIFYAFCMYKNGSGVTFPLFVAASIIFFCLSMAKMGICGKGEHAESRGGAMQTGSQSNASRSGIALKKGSLFYIVTMVLLGISTFCTDDGTIIFFNKLGVFLLLMSFLLKQYFDTSKWKLGKYLGSICILVGASVGELGRPFSDGAAYNKSREKRADRKGWYIALGLLIGVPLLLVVLLLLSSADAVFGQMTAQLLKSISLWGIFNIMFRIGVVFFGAYAMTAYLCKKSIKEEVTDMRRGEPVLAITVTGLLTVLYLFFSVIQIAGLFLGKLRLPEGYTYAMYARQGFFQLLAVSLLNLIIVLCCMSFFRESKVLKTILAVMSLCTFIMIASSFLRMIMYIRYYYLTYMRVLVLWALVLLAVLFVGVTANIFRENFPLFRYSVTAVAVLYLALSFGHPDYIVARVNVANAPQREMWEQEGEDRSGEGASEGLQDSGLGDGFFLAPEPYHDFAYLRTLSADAAPALVPYLRELGYHMEAFHEEDAVAYASSIKAYGGSGSSRSGQMSFGYYWMSKLQRRMENFGIRTYNVSRHLARLLLK